MKRQEEHRYTDGGVLIVPLWNWNVLSLLGNFQDREVLIVPLWNWNVRIYNKYLGDYVVLIVPLWNWNWIVISDFTFHVSFNRTFMELKFDIEKPLLNFKYVLIVPLWNWNWGSEGRKGSRGRFNRTFMELKSITFREYIARIFCFNRTFMELKLWIFKPSATVLLVLIVPLWNWNFLRILPTGGFLSF